jgi:hypothetical protein
VNTESRDKCNYHDTTMQTLAAFAAAIKRARHGRDLRSRRASAVQAWR